MKIDKMEKDELTYHVPVLLKESVDGMNIHPDGTYVDVTFGGAGHSREILSRLGEGGRLLGFDHKGQPQDEVRGGRMLVVLTQALPDNLYRWAMTSSPKNGEIVFRSKTANSPLRIMFNNAYCVSFQRQVGNASGMISKLLISPDEILMNGISFDNHWG